MGENSFQNCFICILQVKLFEFLQSYANNIQPNSMNEFASCMASHIIFLLLSDSRTFTIGQKKSVGAVSFLPFSVHREPTITKEAKNILFFIFDVISTLRADIEYYLRKCSNSCFNIKRNSCLVIDSHIFCSQYFAWNATLTPEVH